METHGGVYFEFPSGTMVLPGDHIVVARNPEALRTLFGRIPRLFGPWGAMPDGDDNRAWLSNRGEQIVLTNEGGEVVDRVHYGSETP